MSQEAKTDLGAILVGALTATGIGTFLFQALGTLILGMLGALGGYLFTHLLKPKLDKMLKKNKEKAG